MLITMLLIAVVVIRKTKLTAMVASAGLAGAALVSFNTGSNLSSIVSLASINALLTFGCIWHWKYSVYKIAGYITWLSFTCLCLSFAQLFVFANISNVDLHNSIQESLSGVFDYITLIIAMLLLFGEDEAYSLHDIKSNFKSYFCRLSGVFGLSRNREGEP